MPRQAKMLTDRQVRALKHPGGTYSAVGGVPGLHIQITPGGSRSWILRIVSGEKRRDMGLGSFPDTSLEDAREAAREWRKSVKGWKEQARTVTQTEKLKSVAASREATATPLPPDPVTLRSQAKAAVKKRHTITFDEAADLYIREHVEHGAEGNKKH